jgi:hypothetical protein
MRMTPSALVLLPKISIIRLTRSNPPWPHGTWDRFSTGHHWPWPRATLRPMAVVARWLLVCRGTVRHAAAQPASEPVKSRTNRYRLTLRALFRYQSSGLLIRWPGTAGERIEAYLRIEKSQVNEPNFQWAGRCS